MRRSLSTLFALMLTPLLGCAYIVGIEDRAEREDPSLTDAGQGGSAGSEAGGSAGSEAGGSAGELSGKGGEFGGETNVGGETSVLSFQIASTSVPGFPEREVPQGASNVFVVFTGSGFVDGMGATLGDIEAKSVTVTGNSAATAIFDIPHGAVIGEQTASLHFEAQRADGGQVTITFIHVGGQDASDDVSLGLGTPQRPYLTLKRAIAASATGDTIQVVGLVAPGPLALNDFINVPVGVRVQGNGPDSSFIDGHGLSANGILLLDGASLQNITVQNFSQSCVETDKSISTSLHDVSLRYCGIRALTPGAQASVEVTSTSPERCEISNTDVGVSASAGAHLHIDGCIVRENASVGVWSKTNADVTLSNVEFRNNGGSTLYGTGLLVESNANTVVDGSLFIDQPHLGLLLQDGSSTPAKDTHLTLLGDNAFINNGNPQNAISAAIWLAGGGSFTATEGTTTFLGNFGGALYREESMNQGDGHVQVKAAHLVLKDNQVVTIQLEGSGDIELSDVYITGQTDDDFQPLKISAKAGKQIKATLVDLVIEGNHTPEALYVEHDVKLSLSASKPGSCVFANNAGGGLWVMNAEAEISGCEIRGNQGFGLRVSDGATVVTHDLQIEKNGASVGDENANVYVNEATLDLNGTKQANGDYSCTIAGASGPGVLVEGGSLRLDGCDVLDSGAAPALLPRAGILARDGAVSMMRSRVRNSNGPGVMSNGPLWLWLSDDTHIESNAAEGLRLTSDGLLNAVITDSFIDANGADSTLPLQQRSGVHINPQSPQGTFSFEGVQVTNNHGAGLRLAGSSPFGFTLAKSKIANNQHQGLLITSDAASIDLGCPAGCIGGSNAFFSNTAAFSSYQESEADVQDARAATGGSFDILDLSVDGSPLGPSQALVSPSKLLPFSTRWGFLKEYAGSPLMIH